ncbi:MAG: hypothetical protein H0X73_04015 [Chthoniobacterales bacterium]|nr:hypothetical protein [Chthoniobacterales bacterium]
MKLNKLRVLAALCVAIVVSPVLALAQSSPGGTTPPMTTTADDRGDRDQDHDYGWIGLLGLAGLGGLLRKRHDDRHDTTGGRTDVRR